MNFKKLMSLVTATAICCGLATASGLGSKTDYGSLYAEAAESSLYNCTFESSAADWSGRGEATATQSGSAAYGGSKSLYVSGRSDSWNGTQMELSTSTFAPGSKYDFSVAVRPEGNGTTTMMLSLQYLSGDETVYAHIATADVQSKKWGVLYASGYTIPAGASDIILYVETESGTSSFYVDDVIIGDNGTITAPLPSGGETVGDINGDGAVNVLDGVILKSYVMSGKLSAPDSADIDGNLTVEANDCLMLNEHLLGLRTSFPERQTPPEPPQSDFEYITDMQHKQFPGNYTSKCQQSGQIVKVNYTSSNNGRGTNANVYLPYGYDQNDTSKKYNVFYLMHGGGENQNTLFYTDVYFGEILDHMIMNGDMEPMIVVTPTFENGGVDKFWNELINDLIPAVEGKYNTYLTSTSKDSIKASRYHRAFGGFSMGGVTTWHCFLNILDYVAYYMPLSGDCWVGNSAEEKAANVANAAKKSGYKPDEYFVFCATGRDDIAYPNIAPQIEAMKKYPDQFIYTSDLSKGNFYFLVSYASNSTHWWGNVRHYIYDILPSFFHEHQND